MSSVLTAALLALACPVRMVTAAQPPTSSHLSSVPDLSFLAPASAWCAGDGLADWRAVAAAANASSWELPRRPRLGRGQGKDRGLAPVDATRANSGVGVGTGVGSGSGVGGGGVGVVMQATDAIGGYAAPFLAAAAAWCEAKERPLRVYGALPLPGCDDGVRATPPGRDGRFGKVWLLAHAVREILAAKESAVAAAAEAAAEAVDSAETSGSASSTGAAQEGPAYPEWLLWLDSDVLVLDPDWLERVLATYSGDDDDDDDDDDDGDGGCDDWAQGGNGLRGRAACRSGTRRSPPEDYGIGSGDGAEAAADAAAADAAAAGVVAPRGAGLTGWANAKAPGPPYRGHAGRSLRGRAGGPRVDLLVADQRNSLFGDINAGTVLVRVTPWSLAFLEAWYGQ